MSVIVPKNITELARRELEEELDRYETPQECLEYLLDDSHFKSISKELMEILQNVCGLTDRSTDEMIQFVAERILELENTSQELEKILEDVCDLKALSIKDLAQIVAERMSKPENLKGYTKDELRNKKKVVARWFNKNVVPDRSSAIKICFALELDSEKAKEFLRKGCKSYAFNVRNAEDAVYMYCLMNRKTYEDALLILKKYEITEAPAVVTAATVAPSSSSTTQILLKAFKDGNMDDSTWKDDDSFLKEFLIPNKKRFIGYAKTAAKIYFEQKRSLQERLIRNSIDEAVNGIAVADNVDADLSREDYNAVIYRLLNTINDFSADHDEFSPLLSLLETDNTTASQIWDNIMELFDQDAFKDPCDKGAFLDKTMPIDAMLREVMHDLPYDRWKADRDFASYTRSSLSDLVQGLTIKRGYEAFEKDPQKNTFTTSTRKIIMLMFYLNYIDGWTPDTDYDEKNYDLFFNELTEILDECQFASLYHADPFDWLMLRSVIGIERYEPWADMRPGNASINEADPSEYFFEVLRLSFDSSSPEKYLSRFEALKRTYEYLCYEDARKFSFGQISYGDRIQHSQSPNASFTYKVDASIDRNLSTKITEAAEQLKELYKETVAAIDTVANEEERNILIKRYIEFKDFDIIADEMKISSNIVFKRYNIALEHVDIPSALLKEFED